jgi:ABC-type nickel/cobalt efflux system permease component RcnA
VGVGHTIALLAAGLLVIVLEVKIPHPLAAILEFGVALMIIFLGGRILFLTLRHRTDVHVHSHSHDGHAHTHFHFHDQSDAHEVATAPGLAHSVEHHRRPLSGWRPLVVGMVHGLAGSAVLTLLVLTEVARGSRARGMAYLLLFGIGSIGGMLLMSTLISLPIVLTTRRFERIEVPMRLVVSISSIAFGLYYAWITGQAF